MTKPKKTILRKKLKTKATATTDRDAIVCSFVDGVTVAELAQEHRLAKKTVYEIISNHWETLTNLRETGLLTRSTGLLNTHKGNNYHALKQIQGATNINKKFLDMLSPDTDMTLSDAEIHFCLLYTSGGNARQAMLKSGLDVGLIQGKSVRRLPNTNKGGFNLGIQLRVEYLKAKPNVARYLNELKMERYLPDAVDITAIQRELLEQLDQVKNDESLSGYNQKNMRLKITEKLGQTISAFSDRVTVEHVDPAKALDYLSTLASANKEISDELIELTPESV